jgi:hypothetical protein
MPYNPLSGAQPIGQLGWRAPLVFILESPIMVAHASMPSPGLIIAIAMQPPAMTATAILKVPGVSSSDVVAVPISLATAAMLAPSVDVFSVITAAPPAMAAGAAMLAPTLSVGRAVAAPVLAAVAAMRIPTVTVVNLPIFDAVGAGSNAAGVGSIGWLHTATAGGCAIAAVATSGTSGVTISGITYGGAAMAPLASIGYNNGTLGRLVLYGLNGVPGGPQTVTATSSAGTNLVGNSLSYRNVSSIGAAATVFGSGTALSQAAACAAGQIIVQAFGTSSLATAFSGLSGGTNRYNNHPAAYGLLLNDATANATFAAAQGAAGNWSGAAVVLS